jgi:zinc protease
MMSVNRTVAPGNRPIDHIRVLAPETIMLDNGIPVYLIDAGVQEVCRIEMVFNAGSYYQSRPLIARFTNLLMSEGTNAHTGFEIASRLEYYGAYLNSFVQKDVAGFSLSLLNSKLEHVLPLLEEILKDACFPEDELQLLTQKEKKTFADDCRKVDRVAHQEFNELIFGDNHPYGKKAQINDFDNVQQEYLIGFHKRYYSAANCFFIVSGKLPPDILKLLNHYFGSIGWLPGSADNDHDEKPFTASTRGKAFREIPDALQNAIRIGKRSISMKHPDHPKLTVLNTILGGYFGSRLMANIREDKGYTYGIYSLLASFKRSGVFFISAEVDANVWAKAIKEIFKEIDRLRQMPVPSGELELVRSYMLGNLQRLLDGPFSTAAFLKSLIEHDINIQEYTSDLFETIRTTTPDEILNTAQQYFKTEDLSEQVVGRK